MNETPTDITLALGLERLYGPQAVWPLTIKAAHAQLVMLKELAPTVFEPALGCAVEAVYGETSRPTRYDFLGIQRQWAFERRFGLQADVRVDLAFQVCRFLLDLLGPNDYQRVVSAAWEVSRCERSAPGLRAPVAHLT